MIIAQITDMHVRPAGKLASERVDTNRMLADTVASLMALPRKPDIVLATGDLTDCGLDSEYEMLQELLDPLSMPVYLVPGNHDRRTALRSVFGSDGYLPQSGEFLHYTLDAGPMRLIGLDTVVPGQGYGEMCGARLDWLDDSLSEAADRPTLIFMHHPPFGTGLADMDTINCRNGKAMAEIVRQYGNVERIVCGHHHRPIQRRWAGTLASVAPSTAHQVSLDLVPDGRPATFTMEPPALQLHVWAEDALVSHIAYVGDFPGPYPFVLGNDYPGQTPVSRATV